MTEKEIKEILLNGEAISCGDEYEKQDVLDLLESIGFTVGFLKTDAVYFKYIFYSKSLSQIHMKNNARDFSIIVPASRILSFADEELFASHEDLYDWEEFFCCEKRGDLSG